MKENICTICERRFTRCVDLPEDKSRILTSSMHPDDPLNVLVTQPIALCPIRINVAARAIEELEVIQKKANG